MTDITEILTPRERFRRVMLRQPVDRVPLDLDGTSLTSIDKSVAAGLAELLGVSNEPVVGGGSLGEAVLDALGIDFRRVGSLIGSGDQEVPADYPYRMDMWGIKRVWTGRYWDIVDPPLKGASVEDLSAYPWPDPDDWIDDRLLEDYAEQARLLWEQTDVVVVAEHPVFGVFELACWMCGFDDFLWRLAGDQEFVHKLFGIFYELQKKFIKPYYQAVGQYIHLTTSGDDFGMQTGPFLSPHSFRTMIKPYFAERIAFTRQFTPAYFWHHTCGSVYDLLPDLIDAGVDILNPIQPGALKMEPERLKHDFGDQVCFHGGFDTQNVLPFGTPEDIETEVRRVMEALKPGGGFIFSAGHNIQDDVPPHNVLTMFQAARRLGSYNNF